MRKIRKRILGLVLALGLIVIANPIRANAEWKFVSFAGWEYFENGTPKTQWFQDGVNWYYLGYDGIMKTGWVNDKGTWYYLMDNGILNNSKTTTTIPDEVNNIYRIIKFYDSNAKFYYSGLTNAPKSLESEIGFANKNLYKFTEVDNYSNTISEYYYSPYDGCAYKIDQGEIVRLGIGDKTITNNNISKEQAIQNVKNYINDNQKNMPLNFEVIQDSDTNNTNAYVVHFYSAEDEKLSNHASSTNGWYYVDKRYGNVISMYDI
jgi:hypothetical protein